MKFLPVKERNMTMLMRLPVRRLSLKVYIENTMIPDIIAHEGSGFLCRAARKSAEENCEGQIGDRQIGVLDRIHRTIIYWI